MISAASVAAALVEGFIQFNYYIMILEGCLAQLALAKLGLAVG